MSNPAFEEHLQYAPMKQFGDAEKNVRVYDEAWTADWWWNVQVRQKALTNTMETC